MVATVAEKRAQVVAQCKVIKHLGEALGGLHGDLARIYANAENESIDEAMIDLCGERTAGIMEWLGDVMNSLDAVTEEDDWTEPVFEAAHRMYPQTDDPDKEQSE